MEDSPDIIRTAYHEAGHAVAHYIFEVPFVRISIVPGEDYCGIVNDDGNYINKLTEEIGGIFTSDAWALKRMDDNIKVLLSGYAAEEVYFGDGIGVFDGKFGAPPDVLAAREILIRLGYMDLYGPFRKYYEDTVVLLREKQNWEAVESLASILMGTRELSGRKASEIIRSKIYKK
jgi:hypothetical protein